MKAIAEMNIQQRHQTVTASIPSIRDNSWWWFNLITTIAFIPLHLFILGIIFYSYSDVNISTYIWSGLQLLLALYSYVLLFGSVAIQIVLLYVRFPVRVLLGIYLASGLIMLTATVTFLIVDTLRGDES